MTNATATGRSTSSTNNVSATSKSSAKAQEEMVLTMEPPFTTHPHYSESMRGVVADWGFMSAVRRKKVPLNKYGLPDVSGEQIEKGAERQARIEMRRNMRDHAEKVLIAGWDDGTGFGSVIDLFSQLLELFCSFVGSKHGEKFRKALDIDVLRQMVDARVYTPEEFRQTVEVCVALLHELESPYQNALTQRWHRGLKYDYTSTEDFAKAICDTIMFLFLKCDLCKLEVENYYISRIPPESLKERERQAFEKIPLPLRAPWDCSTKDKFAAGLLQALSSEATKLSEDAVTSCLALDLPTLHKFQNSLQEATLLAVMSAVFNKIFMKWQHEEQAEYIDSVVETYRNTGGPNVFFDLLKPRLVEAEVASAKEACAQLVKCADISDPLYKVFRDRVVKFISAENPSPDVLGSKPAHLSHANVRVLELADSFHEFVDEHWQVYNLVYTKSK